MTRSTTTSSLSFLPGTRISRWLSSRPSSLYNIRGYRTRVVTGTHADCPTSIPFIFRTAGPADSSSSRSSLLYPFQLQSTQPQSFGSHTGATRAALRKGETATDGPVTGVAGTSGSSGGAADHGRLDLSGYRYTGMGPGRSGGRPSRGSLHTYGFINTNQLTNQLRKEGPRSRRGRPLLSVRFE